MSSRLRRTRVAVLATIIAATLVPALGTSARAADQNPNLTVTIATLTPSWLKSGSDVTVGGSITNNDDHAWGKVQAYLVIPTNPLTTRAQLDDAVASGDATGTRVIDLGSYDEIGNIAPGQTVAFEIKVPYGQLGISGGAGVYPVGVQVLGTDTDGTRETEAIARTTTFLPSVADDQKRVPTTIVWTFLMPDSRRQDGNYRDPAGTLAAIGPNGRLRNLLDLAMTTPPRSSTVVIDPALLVGVDDIANKRHIAKDVELTEAQTTQANDFLEELLAYVRSQNTWILDFDRPDVLALAANPDLRRPLSAAADAATQAVLTTYQLTGRRVTWPTKKGVTASLLATERRSGETPVIVTPGSVPGWERRLGSIVSYKSTRGPVPLLVNDLLAPGAGNSSVVNVRQRILSDAALAGLQRAIDSKSRADAVTMVDPTWDPGPSAASDALASAFQSPFTTGATLDDLLTQPLSTYKGKVPSTSTARTVSRSQLESASDLLTAGSALGSITTGDDDVAGTYAREAAGLLGVRWRLESPLGISVARNQASRAAAELAKIRIEGPPSVTLSSSSGGFPLTIVNDSSHGVRVGVKLDSSNPSLNLPPVKAVNIAAGERQTLTVNIDLGSQRTTQLTARLVSSDGTTVGDPARPFNVSSSKIGVVLWVAIGLAGVLVLVAMFRRFHRRRTGKDSTTARLEDDD